jgi:cytochrome P450 family 142 subfamily A polypeptide 1
MVDLLDGAFYAGDPYPTYAWLRDNDPVHWDATNGIWGVSRYADVHVVEKQPGRYSSASGSRPKTPDNTSMINRDDPDHQEQRSMVSRQFTPRAVHALEDRVRTVAVELLDAVAGQGYCDVVHDLAAPLPAMLIGEKLGFPPALLPRCVYWSETTMRLGGGPRSSRADGMAAAQDFGMATWQLIQERRASPEDDLISLWVSRDMPDTEIIAEALLLLDGGAETTRTVIGSTVLALIEHPSQLAILRDDPSVLGTTAVEEFIRWVTPILNMRRTAVSDQRLADRSIKAGDELLLMYSSANRDPAVFEDPETFDVTRRHNPHVAFGFGTHFCLGAALARLEIRVMFEELLPRLGDLRLAANADPRIQPSAFTRGLKDLHVEFTAG